MTFAPPTLVALGKYLVSQGCVNLGIVGDTAHQTTGTSYHLGKSALKPDAYSRQTARDKAGLSEAASAIDIGKVAGALVGLQKLSNWLARECANRAIDTLDIREVIWSPDGSKVLRWDREGIPPTTGSDSHLTHSHVSFYRDSEFRDHTQVFRRYFEEAEVITAIVGEDWRPTQNAAGTSNGVLRRTPSRAADLVRDAAGNVVRLTGVVRTIAEVKADGNDWRLTKYGDDPAYFLRADLAPTVPGGDPETAQELEDYLNQKPPVDCGPLVSDAVAAEYNRVTSNTTATVHFPGPPA